MSNSWDTAYNNSGAVADAAQWLADWARDAATFRAAHADRLSAAIPYGGHAREVYDLYQPGPDAPGTLVFVHGGYWRAVSREDNHHYAAGPLARGWRVAFVEYPLCPEVTLEAQMQSVIRGITAVAARVDGPLVLAGHSAGGHHVTHPVVRGSTLPQAVRQRVRRVISFSGLHDLRPIALTQELNRALGLDEARAAALSPALGVPDLAGDLLCIVGADELPELRRQTHLLANVWTGLGVTARALELAGEHHFSVLEGLRAPGTAVTRWATLADAGVHAA